VGVGADMETTGHLLDRGAVGAAIAARGRRREFAAGEILFLEGDHSDNVYVCVEGAIRIYLTLPTGRELMVGVKTPGQEFGELSAFDGRARSASAAAMEASVVSMLPADEFVSLLGGCSQLSVAMCEHLSVQLRRANDRLVAQHSDSAAVRTGRMLVELSSLMMRHGQAAESYDVPITQDDLATWIGATRESTARALARFRKAGLVKTSRGCITVCDVMGLTRMIATC